MNFEQAYVEFIESHLQKRSGERKGRLERGHQVAEKLFCQNIWWPLRGHFDQLHPEFEVLDWRGRSYFCDFAWITEMVKLIIEIKGFGPHVRDMDRQKYCNELNRETFLTSMGFHVISFAFDDVAYRPELCISLLRMVLSRFQTPTPPLNMNSVIERELVRLAHTLARPIRPVDVTFHLGINHRTAIRALQNLCDKKVFTPIKGKTGKYIVQYELHTSILHNFF